jgi:hypothetical protein
LCRLRSGRSGFDILLFLAVAGAITVGRCTLTPPDPYLKGAWYPGGFKPCTYQVKNRFQIFPAPFKCNLRRYITSATLCFVSLDLHEKPPSYTWLQYWAAHKAHLSEMAAKGVFRFLVGLCTS